MKMTSMAIVALALCLSFFTGCQSAAPSGSAAAPSKAVIVTTRGGQQTVLLPSTNGGPVAVLADGDDHTCAKCKEDAVSFFKGGTMVTQCTACGATYKPLAAK